MILEVWLHFFKCDMVHIPKKLVWKLKNTTDPVVDRQM